MITKQQAGEIMVLASNYAHWEAAMDVAYASNQLHRVGDLKNKSKETWLKLKALVESVTEE